MRSHIACPQCGCIHSLNWDGVCDHRSDGSDCFVWPVTNDAPVLVLRFVERPSGFTLAVRTKITNALATRNHVVGHYNPGKGCTYVTRKGVMFQTTNLTRSQWESRVRTTWEEESR